MDFKVDNLVETHNQGPYKAYRVRMDGNVYVVAYDGEHIKEVYFMFYKQKYFMSCRSDMKTISHYYIDGDIIRRYEEGILNREYFILDDNTGICYVNNEKRIYSTQRGVTIENPNKIQVDLLQFLEKFNSLALSQFFNPQEPK